MVITGNRQIEKPVAATIGMFDGVHAGHRYVLSVLREKAQERGLASAAITFPLPPQSVVNPGKQYRVLMSLDEKEEALESEGIDFVVVLDFNKAMSMLTAREFLKLIRDRYGVKFLLVGYDHHFGHDRKGFDDYAAYGSELGVEVCLCPKFEMDGRKVASSAIRELVANGDVACAATLMGRHYRLEGEVVAGYQNGRKLGFPTANIRISDNCKVIPCNGVYAVSVFLPGGIEKEGMLNIGYRPTVGSDGHVSVEVNIFDFSADIYGMPIAVEFVARLRDERKLESLDALKSQLAADKEVVKNILSKKHEI